MLPTSPKPLNLNLDPKPQHINPRSVLLGAPRHTRFVGALTLTLDPKPQTFDPRPQTLDHTSVWRGGGRFNSANIYLAANAEQAIGVIATR